MHEINPHEPLAFHLFTAARRAVLRLAYQVSLTQGSLAVADHIESPAVPIADKVKRSILYA